METLVMLLAAFFLMVGAWGACAVALAFTHELYYRIKHRQPWW